MVWYDAASCSPVWCTIWAVWHWAFQNYEHFPGVLRAPKKDNINFEGFELASWFVEGEKEVQNQKKIARGRIILTEKFHTFRVDRCVFSCFSSMWALQSGKLNFSTGGYFQLKAMVMLRFLNAWLRNTGIRTYITNISFHFSTLRLVLYVCSFSA